MSSLGVYFGYNVISIVETKGRKLINKITIPKSAISGSELEEKVPDEIKIVALLKNELRKNKIDVKEATLCLSGKDLIIRTFEIPVLPANELPAAIGFEVKKYIPFKVEELVYDFQVKLDKISRRNLVLFIGIKKEDLDKYFSIFNQLNIKPGTIEYSAFSILRFIQLTRMLSSGVAGIITIDFEEENEANFTILENGFPLFSRDITLTGRPDEFTSATTIKPEVLSDKLKTEIRISLDYYDRKFPTKNIENTFFICSENYRSTLDSTIKDIGLTAHFIETSKFIDMSGAFSISLIKGYGCSLYKIIKTPLKIDLLSARTKAKLSKEALAEGGISLFLSGIKVSIGSVMLGLLMCLGIFLFNYYRIAPLKRELATIVSLRPKVVTINPETRYSELENIRLEYKKKIEELNTLLKGRLYLADYLYIIPKILPDGLWLSNFNMKKSEDTIELKIDGSVNLGDSNKELAAVNAFVAKLKETPIFANFFKEINIVYIERSQFGDATVTTFSISCRGKGKI